MNSLKFSNTYDPEGRLLYIEEGYTVVTITRIYIGDTYSATETEYLIYDKSMELIFNATIIDTYITD